MDFPVDIKKYFESHKINEQVLEGFQISWNGKQIVYPIKNASGETIFYIYRQFNKEPRFLYQLGSHASLYGIHKIQNEKTVVIAEGLSDMLCCWSQGVPAVTSTGGAKTFKEEWKDLLCDKEIIICLDSDKTGQEATAKILDIFPEAKIILLPERKEQKDLSDFVSSGGDLHKLLQTARHFNNIEEIEADAEDRIALWQNTWFHDSYLANHREKEVETAKKPYKGNGDDLQRAKQFPIDRLIKFGRDNKAPSIFHNDHNSSMHLYRDKNRIYCFGCSKSADVLDIYMQLNNCSLTEAIKALK